MSIRASGTIRCSRAATGLNVVDAVVDEVDLPAAVQLAQDRVADQVVAEPRDPRLDRQPIGRRRLQVRDRPHAQQRHVQRPRDRRGRHRQHVDRRPQRLEPLLHLDAEPLLLVDDQQAQILELHVRRRQPVRADEDVELPVGRALQDLLLLLRRAEPRERRDRERELRHPGRERAAVLLGEHRRRHQHGHLVAGVDRLERRADRHLRLAEADVAAQQPVHRPRAAACRA